MSKLMIAVLAAFSVATMAFIGVGFGSGTETFGGLDDASEAAGDTSLNGPEITAERTVESDARHDPITAHRVVRADLRQPAHAGHPDDEPQKTYLKLPTNLPKLPDHRLTMAGLRDGPTDLAAVHFTLEGRAMALAARTIDALVVHVVKLEQAPNNEIGQRELMAMHRAMRRFEKQWRPLQSKLNPQIRKRIEQYATKRAGNLLTRLQKATQRLELAGNAAVITE